MRLLRENPLTLAQAAASLPGRPSLRTVWRWALRGCRGAKLETMNVGGKRFTTREALDRFVHRTTAAANPDLSAQVSKRRLRALEQAERELDRAGI